MAILDDLIERGLFLIHLLLSYESNVSSESEQNGYYNNEIMNNSILMIPGMEEKTPIGKQMADSNSKANI